jgi:hypothetical protein
MQAFLEILNMYRKGQKTITDVYDEVAVLFRQHQVRCKLTFANLHCEERCSI